MAKRPKEKKMANGKETLTAPATGAVASPLPSWSNRDWLWTLILLLAVMLAYQPVWYAGYIWDDDDHLTANPCIVGPLGFTDIWTTSAADISPFTRSTFWLEHALWGLAPLPYHLVNVLLHGACAIVLWRVLRSLQVPGAWLGAALWALHPVEVESVAWITEMKNTESGLFFLLSILFFLRWLGTKDLDRRTGGGWNYGLTVLFSALAMASKSSTVILPGVLCLSAWWMEGRWHWRNLARVAPIVLLSVAASALSIWTQRLQLATSTDPQWVRTWPERLVTAGDAVWFYLGKLLWPHLLITIYPRWKIDAGHALSYFPLLAVMILLFILWLYRGSWSRPWLFVVAYFLAALLPILGLIDNTIFHYSFVFDHFQYLAGMGPLALAGAGLVGLKTVVLPNQPWLHSSLCIGLLLVLALLSWQRTWVYESEETLWTDTLAKNPNCWLGYYNLGNTLFKTGKTDAAMADYQKALEINPNYAFAHNNLGMALSRMGREDEATSEFQQALALDPANASAHANLGLALFQKGQTDDGTAQFQKALELDPNNATVRYNFGNILLGRGQMDEAMAEFQKALEINPGYAEAHNALGSILLQTGRIDEAMAEFQKALDLNPDDEAACNNLGFARLQTGQVADAMDEFQKALAIDPTDAAAHGNLGIALFQNGQADDAIAELQKALALNPNDSKIHYNLGNILVQKGRLDEAITQFQEAVSLNPGYSNALRNLAKAQAMVQQAHGSR